MKTTHAGRERVLVTLGSITHGDVVQLQHDRMYYYVVGGELPNKRISVTNLTTGNPQELSAGVAVDRVACELLIK